MSEFLIDRGVGRQANSRDFRRPTRGWDDPEEIETAVDVINAIKGKPRDPVGSARMVNASLLALRLATRPGLSSRREDVLEAAIKAQTKQIEQQRATIERLLDFVPTRHSAIDSSRLLDLVRRVKDALEPFLPAGASHAVVVIPEDDPETDACHRFVVSVTLPEGTMTPMEEVETEASFLRAFAAMASPIERRAFSVSIDFTSTPA